MNKNFKMVLVVALLSVTTLYAADSLIGTDKDPVVTKSYVDKVIAGLSSSSNNNVQAELKEQEKKLKELTAEIEALKDTSSSEFEIVTVGQGSTIYGKQGSEMIIRSGEGIIVASAAGGIQDVTDGVDLSSGIQAPNNNLLIIPREDGRGIEAARTMIVMVRGGYSLQ